MNQIPISIQQLRLKTNPSVQGSESSPDEPVPYITDMWCHSRGSTGYQLSAGWECRRELMKLPKALFSYTKKLMTGFLTGHSSPGGEAISKLAQVRVVSENKVHGRGQSLALSWQLLKIGFRWRTHGAHLRWSLLGWHCTDTTQQCGSRLPEI